MSVGDNIKRIRLEKGIKATDLAERIGVSKSAVSQWENGKDPAKLSTIQRIADALQVSPYSLLDEDEDEALKKANQILEREVINEVIEEEREDAALLLREYNKLNSIGKSVAIDTVRQLTTIEAYTEDMVRHFLRLAKNKK